MKYTTQLFYSVHNGGDGSAYPHLMESAELASYDQDSMDEGWGEDCSGSFTVESDSPIRIVDDVMTKEQYLINKIDGEHEDIEEFIARFFPNGVPRFTVKREENPSSKSYCYFNFYVDGQRVGKLFTQFTTKEEELEKTFNDEWR
jgi:hypothetical protein